MHNLILFSPLAVFEKAMLPGYKLPQLGNAIMDWKLWRDMSLKMLRIIGSSFVQQLVKPNIQENIKAPHYWPWVRGIHLSLVVSLTMGQ